MKRIELWQLSHIEQDKLWNDNKCPKCNEKIVNKVSTEDYATWQCKKCNIYFIVE